MTVVEIAELCHELNRAYCETIGDFSQVPWGDAEDWQRDSAINGVQFHLDNPESTPEDSHANWMREKIADGWTYGDEKDVDAKTHHCMVPYSDLPVAQQFKDTLFVTTVRFFSKYLGGVFSLRSRPSQ